MSCLNLMAQHKKSSIPYLKGTKLYSPRYHPDSYASLKKHKHSLSCNSATVASYSFQKQSSNVNFKKLQSQKVLAAGDTFSLVDKASLLCIFIAFRLLIYLLFYLTISLCQDKSPSI